MQQILVYGDSLSWGIVPGTRERFAFNVRWPGALEHGLQAAGKSVRVIEDCLNGRRTVLEDPFKAGRNGQQGLAQRIEINSPLALVIVALGTNDLQNMHTHTAWHAAQGVAALVQTIRQAPIEPTMMVPPILIIAPPLAQTPKGAIAGKFIGIEQKCVGLVGYYQEVAQTLGCHFFDANTVTTSSKVDGIHLDADQHLALGSGLVSFVSKIIL